MLTKEQLALKTISALQDQWYDEPEVDAIDIICEIGEIARYALGNDESYSAGALEAMNSVAAKEPIRHWLI